jgi:hypothetical protein
MRKDSSAHLPEGEPVIAQTDLLIPDYLIHGYRSAVDFTREMCAKGSYKGLLLLFGSNDKYRRVLSNRLNGRLTQEYQEHNPVLYSDRLPDLYREMEDRDGGIAFDLDGDLIGTEVFVQKVSETRTFRYVMGMVMEKKGRNRDGASTRHLAAAFASRHGVPAVAVSSEVGTVMTFKGGMLVDELFFDPLLNR